MKNEAGLMETKKVFGNKGEESAASFLCGKGFRIIGRNVRLSHSEIDIIAKNDKNIIFVEVKTRRSYPNTYHSYGRPAAAVGFKKRAKLLEGAKKYIDRFGSDFDGLQPRIDVIEVYISPECEKYKVLKIIHMPNAVTGG